MMILTFVGFEIFLCNLVSLISITSNKRVIWSRRIDFFVRITMYLYKNILIYFQMQRFSRNLKITSNIRRFECSVKPLIYNQRCRSSIPAYYSILINKPQHIFDCRNYERKLIPTYVYLSDTSNIHTMYVQYNHHSITCVRHPLAHQCWDIRKSHTCREGNSVATQTPTLCCN